MLILADGGGSNGHRPRLRKTSLQERIADRYGLHGTACHYPTGASKWNPVEHRLFGPVSINWAGQPLRSLEILMGWVRGDGGRRRGSDGEPGSGGLSHQGEGVQGRDGATGPGEA